MPTREIILVLLSYFLTLLKEIILSLFQPEKCSQRILMFFFFQPLRLS